MDKARPEDPGTLLQRADEKRRSGDSAAALDLALLALERSDRDDPVRSAHILCAIGQFQRDLGALPEARDAYAEAAKHAVHAGDQNWRAHALRHQGDLDRELGRLDDAHTSLKEALQIHRANGNPNGLARANTERVLALVHQARGEPNKAKSYWRSARAIYAARGVVDCVAECDTMLSK